MEVSLEAHGLIGKILGCKHQTVVLPEGANVKELIESLNIRINVSWLVISVNGRIVSLQSVLTEGDSISILPICGGG